MQRCGTKVIWIVVVLATLYTTGRAAVGPEAGLRDVFGEAESYNALLWGSLGGAVVVTASGALITRRYRRLAEGVREELVRDVMES